MNSWQHFPKAALDSLVTIAKKEPFFDSLDWGGEGVLIQNTVTNKSDCHTFDFFFLFLFDSWLAAGSYRQS